MLIDTDVLIWMMRGHAGAAQRLQSISTWRISAVTYMELAQGCRNKQELAQIKKGLMQRQTEILPINTSISNRAMQLIEAYALSHSLQLGDALIAATALEHGLIVLTANTKHFSAVDSLTIECFMPS
jgi:predicted nucleic acid-binding protein